MSEAADEYLAHLGIEVDEELKEAESFAHYGKKGMKWGVRNDDRPSGRSSGGSSKSGGSASKKDAWVEDQKGKLKTVGKIALIAGAAVGGYIAYNTVSAYGNDVIQATAGRQFKATANDAQKMTDMFRKAAEGHRAAAETLRAHGSKPVPKMDPALRKFIDEGPARLLADQRGWSDSLGVALGKIQGDDAKFIADHIKNNVPKALGR